MKNYSRRLNNKKLTRFRTPRYIAKRVKVVIINQKYVHSSKEHRPISK